jgi:hypothetical protein
MNPFSAHSQQVTVYLLFVSKMRFIHPNKMKIMISHLYFSTVYNNNANTTLIINVDITEYPSITISGAIYLQCP